MSEEKKKKLTQKEADFCSNYVNSVEHMYNGTQAAIAAGYSAKTAGEIASQNLRKLHIRERITELIEEKRDIQAELRERVVDEYKKIGFSKDTEQVSNTDKLKALDKLGLYSNMFDDEKDQGNVTIIINE